MQGRGPLLLARLLPASWQQNSSLKRCMDGVRQLWLGVKPYAIIHFGILPFSPELV
jgi:hypothetical protein